MRTIKLLTITLLMAIGLLLAACGGASAPTSQECDKNGLCIALELEEPVQMNEPVAVTITVQSEQDMASLPLNIWFSAPDIVVIDGESKWTIDDSPERSGTLTATHSVAPGCQQLGK